MEPPLKKLKMDYSTAVSPMQRKHETITLLPAEKLLRDLLLECRTNLQKNGVAAASDLRMWITGGWVRDRLLGIPCSDIDIALSTMTGKQFGDLLTEYYKARKGEYEQRAAQLGIKDTKFTSFHTTKKNVGKSKNLETTMGRVYGLDLDLVNLRKEVYDEDSRTPGMEFGTPEEDAFRRDANVNSMFFDLDKQEVVDLTGKGLCDMEAGIVRTPLEPRKTFLDDPLRVLRLIRFASKLGYELDAETEKWMSDSEIHKALNTKVSRERVGIEVFKMMKQPNPQIAFKVLFDANLYELVFLGLDAALREPLTKQLPGISEEKPWPATWPRAYQVLAMLLRDETTELGRMVRSEPADLVWVMAAYAPVAGLRETSLKKAVAAATDAIKMTTSITKLLDSSLRHADAIREIVALVDDNSKVQPPRSSVGMAIHSWGETWKLQVVYSLLSEIVYDPSPLQPSSYLSHDNVVLERLLTQYNSFMDYVTEKKLHGAHLLRPVLDGNEMMNLFGVKKGGRFLRTAIDELVAWQFDHPDAGREEATEWLLLQRRRLGITSAGA